MFQFDLLTGEAIPAYGPARPKSPATDTGPGAPQASFAIPEDTSSTATLPIGDTRTDSIEFVGDGDFYRVTLVAGQSYLFTMTGFGGTPLADAYLELYDPNGVLVALDDDAGPGTDSLLRWTATQSGTFFLNARAYEESGVSNTGGYAVTATLGPPQNPLSSIDLGFSVASNPITIFFADSGTNPFGDSALRAWSSGEIAAVMQATATFSAITQLSFVQTFTQQDARFVFQLSDLEAGTLGYVGTTDGVAYGAFDPLGSGWTQGLAQGGLGFGTLIHEIGHALGLAHPHDNGGSSEVMQGVISDFNSYGTFLLNQGVFTMMTYNDGYPAVHGNPGTAFGHQGTPMALDVALLQQKYGANFTTGAGNTFYDLPIGNFGGTFYSAIWDVSGTDAIRTFFAAGATIDLRPATLQNAVGGGGYVSSNLQTVGGFTIAAGVMIENAMGFSGPDTLIGNDGANLLDGGEAQDTLNGGAGRDILTGGSVGDTLTGGVGADVFRDTSLNLQGDYIVDLEHGDRINVTDVASASVSLSGSTLLVQGSGLGLGRVPAGRLYTESDGASGTNVFILQAPHTNDFNTDGKSDLLWRLPSGDTAVWTMDSNTVTGGYGAPVPGAPWALAEQADLSGDGKTDLVWRHAGSGDVAVWTMSNGTVLAGLGIPNPGVNWSLSGSADFNADGRSDLLWRNNISGDFAVWMMESNVIVASGGPGGLPAAWHVVGLTDFDGDGRSDLLLRNDTGNHDLAIWTMTGASVKAGLGMLNPGAPWQVVATGDFNNDGKGDIVFRHESTGDVALWEMDANTLIAGLGLPNPGPAWTLADVNDYNGDGFSDLLWRHGTTGDTALWLMQNNTILAGLGGPNPGGEWLPTVHHFDII